MGKKIDLTGQTFSNLFVIKFLCINNRNKSYYLCRCTCGKEKPVRIDHLRSGKTTSCGHVGNQHSVESCTTHKLSYNPLYFVWYQMMTRCYNQKFQDYHNYGGRGIEVCAEWFDILEPTKNHREYFEDTEKQELAYETHLMELAQEGI